MIPANTSRILHERKRYSFTWAEQIVEKLKNSYPRATEFIKELYDLTDRNLAALLASADPLFPLLRKQIHIYDKTVMVQGGWTQEELLHTRKVDRWYWARKGQERLVLGLDRASERAKLKEQESRGAPERGEAERGSLPSSSRRPSFRHEWVQPGLFDSQGGA